MILDKIILDNFAIYGGRHEFNLTPITPARPVILFGGLNGSGKTTFLDAVQLALYGRNARCSNRGSLSYEAFLRETLHRGADPAAGASIEVHFRRTTEGTETRFELVRRWADTGKGFRERVEILQDGVLNPLLSENWAEHMEAYLPGRIADLFFFDGEQIKELAEGATAAAMLKSAVDSLLGLDIVDRLVADLLVVERRKRLAAKDDGARQKLAALQKECEGLQALHSAAVQEAAEAQNVADRQRKHLTDAEKLFRDEGGELHARKAEIEAERERTQARVHDAEEALRELAAGPLPLALLAPQLKELERQAANEVARAENLLLVSLLEKRDARLLEVAASQGTKTALVAELETFLRSDRDARVKGAGAPSVLEADAHTLEAVRHLRRFTLPKIESEARAKVNELGGLQRSLDLLDAQLAQVPQDEALAALTLELAKHRSNLRDAKARLDALEAKRDQLARELNAKRAGYSRELEAHEHTVIGQDNDDRILLHSKRVRETLARFRVAAVAHRVATLESLIFDSFSQLIRKEHFLAAIKIDPADFSVRLIAPGGQPLPVARLSTGERQLLATSMLWGLARASGRTVPTIIDTPLGRLDSSHRGHLVQRYFPVASHQVILLSTDEEIDECHLERLKPYLSRSYRLEYDNALRSTIPKEGYFWK